MRFEFEEIRPKHWHWTLWWGDRKVANAPETYGSEGAAHAAALAFSREVGRAQVER